MWRQQQESESDPCVLKAAFEATSNPTACAAGSVVEEAHRDPDGTRVITTARLYAVALVPAEAVPVAQRAHRLATPDR